jgi:murein DD-endopeptidase MepM/ murein hydrolase activator NlpD
MAGARFSPEQLQVARGLLSAPQYRGAGPKVKQALGETGIVESGLSNPRLDSEGSAGPLQQTPKNGWGSEQQVRNPRYAAEAFLKRAIPLAGKYGTAGELAQAVQRSAYPKRYDEHAAEAAQLLQMLGGNPAPHQALTAMGAGAAPAQAEAVQPVGPSAAQSADLTQLLQSLAQPQQRSSLAETPLTRPQTSGGPEQAAGSPRVPSPLAPAAAPASGLDAQLALVAKIGEDAAPEAAAAEGGISRESSPATSGISQAAGKYVNPLPGFTKGRTDMGVDYSAKPGAPIKAIGNAKILGISPNWYQGQPYLSYELLDGPQKGKVVYVAEQINPSVKAGQRVAAGQRIGTYAQSGTGIETGFGTSTGGRTLAQATGNTGDVTHGNAPAGIQIRQLLERLGAR